MALVNAPTVTGTIDQNYLIEPLNGGSNPMSYLDIFAEEVYNKSFDTHLVRFIYALLGPAGIGWLHYNYLQARLIFEQQNISLADLDAFYGDPMSFGRIFSENYDNDPSGLLTKDQWAQIKAQDAQYRNRAIDYMNAIRAGGTPLGMRLAARSGLGHEVEIVENYRYFYDQNSDQQLGVPYYGSSSALEEMIVIPRNETLRTTQQTITLTGTPTSGYFELFFNGETGGPITWNASAAYSNPSIVSGIYQDVQSALEATPGIGVGQVQVTGGPGPSTPWVVTFRNRLANQDVSLLSLDPNLSNSLFGANATDITIKQTVAAVAPADDLAYFDPHDVFHMVNATQRLKPMPSFLTFNSSTGKTQLVEAGTISVTSEMTEVPRFITGRQDTTWPPRDSVNWVESGVEHQAPVINTDLQFHYTNFLIPANVTGYTDLALGDLSYAGQGASALYSSQHVGTFSPTEILAFPYLGEFTDPGLTLLPRYAVTETPYTPIVRTQVDIPPRHRPHRFWGLVYGHYMLDLVDELFRNQIRKHKPKPKTITISTPLPQTTLFWSSVDRQSGSEFLEIDFGSTQAVNYLSFEVIGKPIDMTITYDMLDQSPARLFREVTPSSNLPWSSTVLYHPELQAPWIPLEFNFGNTKGEMIYTRFVRIEFARRATPPFLIDARTNYQHPWGIQVRNLRIGRNVSNL